MTLRLREVEIPVHRAITTADLERFLAGIEKAAPDDLVGIPPDELKALVGDALAMRRLGEKARSAELELQAYKSQVAEMNESAARLIAQLGDDAIRHANDPVEAFSASARVIEVAILACRDLQARLQGPTAPDLKLLQRKRIEPTPIPLDRPLHDDDLDRLLKIANGANATHAEIGFRPPEIEVLVRAAIEARQQLAAATNRDSARHLVEVNRAAWALVNAILYDPDSGHAGGPAPAYLEVANINEARERFDEILSDRDALRDWVDSFVEAANPGTPIDDYGPSEALLSHTKRTIETARERAASALTAQAQLKCYRESLRMLFEVLRLEPDGSGENETLVTRGLPKIREIYAEREAFLRFLEESRKLAGVSISLQQDLDLALWVHREHIAAGKRRARLHDALNRCRKDWPPDFAPGQPKMVEDAAVEVIEWLTKQRQPKEPPAQLEPGTVVALPAHEYGGARLEIAAQLLAGMMASNDTGIGEYDCSHDGANESPEDSAHNRLCVIRVAMAFADDLIAYANRPEQGEAES